MQRRDLTRACSYPGQLNIPQDLTIIGFQHHMDRLEKIFFPQVLLLHTLKQKFLSAVFEKCRCQLSS
jgi:hypothetical protein